MGDRNGNGTGIEIYRWRSLYDRFGCANNYGGGVTSVDSGDVAKYAVRVPSLTKTGMGSPEDDE